MKISEDYILRKIGTENVIVPTGVAATELNAMITLNQTGLLIWEDVASGKTPEEIIQHMLDLYEVTEELAVQDVHGFLGMLKERNILIED